MTPELLTIGMFGTLLVMIIGGVSLSFALGGVAVIFTLILSGTSGLFPMISAVFGSMWSILLTAVPFFVFMGVGLARSRISENLYEAFYLWSGRVNGGLLLGTAGFAAALSAMTGSCAASTLTTGKVGLPAMEKHGYDKLFALGTIGAAGTLGILIPPSVTLIVIGMTTGLSVGKLFMGGLIAGLLVLAMIMAYIAIRSYVEPSMAPAVGRPVHFSEKLRSLRSVIVPLVIMLSVLLTIFSGLATPTEAAAVGALAVFLAVALRGEVDLQFIRQVVHPEQRAYADLMALWSGPAPGRAFRSMPIIQAHKALRWARILRMLWPQPQRTAKRVSPKVPFSGQRDRRPSVFM